MNKDKIEPASELLKRILAERRKKWEANQLARMKAKDKTPKNDNWKKEYKEPEPPDTSNLPELPKGWIWSRIEQLSSIVTKGSSPRWQGFQYVDSGVPFVRSQNVGWGYMNLSKLKYVPNQFNEKESRSILHTGDVLINIVGASIGRAAVTPAHLNEGNTNQAVSIIRLIEGSIIPDLLVRFLISSNTQNMIHSKKVEVARPNLSLQDVNNIVVPLPPKKDQLRIVAKLEELFSKLDAGLDSLHKAKALLKQYRQSVLKSVMEGKLTAEWRKMNKDKIEPATELLKRILAERRKKWEADQLANMKAKGKTPKNDNWKKKYKEPEPPDTSNLPELPEGWIWCNLSLVCEKIQDGSHYSPKKQYSEPTPNRYMYLTSKNVRNWGIDLSTVTYVDNDFHNTIYPRCNPIRGDVFLTKDGVNTGAAAVFELDEEVSLLSSIALFKPESRVLNSYFLKYFFNSPIGFSIITGQMTGTAIKRIILAKVRNSVVALPSLSEQQRIVTEIERYLSICDRIEVDIEENKKMSDRLKSVILRDAFQGKLVAQEFSDEPVEISLERIEETKLSDKNHKKKRKPKRII